MSPARLARFSAAANGDKNLALRLYIWNARLCEAFYLPLQVAEIAVRNAVHIPLRSRFGPAWFSSGKFLDQMPKRYKEEVYETVQREAARRGAAFTGDHVVAALTFGFWVHLLTSRYDNILWQGGVSRSFPHITRGMTRADVHEKVERLRDFRNLVAHHSAIFDRGPKAEYQNLVDILGLICPDTLWLLGELSNPDKVINARPRI